jgi:GntR family transcriptional regulator
LKGDEELIFIDYHSRVPIYEQIKEQIIMLINTGVYKPNDKLPSIRALSKELNINVNTIKRAFSDLERDGVTYSAQGRGIFVCADPIGNEKIKASALNDIKTAVQSGKAKGVSKDDIICLLDEIYEVGD